MFLCLDLFRLNNAFLSIWEITPLVFCMESYYEPVLIQLIIFRCLQEANYVLSTRVIVEVLASLAKFKRRNQLISSWESSCVGRPTRTNTRTTSIERSEPQSGHAPQLSTVSVLLMILIYYATMLAFGILFFRVFQVTSG